MAKIAVLVKQVPDTNSKIIVSERGKIIKNTDFHRKYRFALKQSCFFVEKLHCCSKILSCF